MSLGVDELAGILRAVGPDEWVVRERRRRRAERRPDSRRAEDDRRLEGTLFQDTRRGRGESAFTVGGESREEATARARAAARRAEQGRGPIWALPPPAAPARVAIADPDLPEDPGRALDRTWEAIFRAAAPAHRAVQVRAAVERRSTGVVTSGGFSASYEETWIELDLVLVRSGTGGALQRAPLRRRVRRLADLDLPRLFEGAARGAEARAAAGSPEPGRYDLLLSGPALSPEPGGYGWLAPFVAQARGDLVREGFTQYQPGQSIYGPREPGGDRLTLASDGTLPFAPRSRPFGELGEPVRRWEIVRDGVAQGVALDAREAGLRGELPNGGVANLVLGGGSADLDALRGAGGRPLLEIVELSAFEVDERSGAFAALIGFGYLRGEGAPRPVAGGTITGNAFDFFARVRFSRERERRGWYLGPRAARVDDVPVL